MTISSCLKSATLVILLTVESVLAQTKSQARADYTLRVSLDVQTHRVKGSEKIVYDNQSTDTLREAYFHLYFNAFQPNSMMDIRSRNIADPDRRVGNRIAQLKENEIGYQKILSIKQNEKSATFTIDGTLMKVKLPSPILPKTKTVFTLQFESQVPKQIRRSGRDNSEGISYSMTQWFPKLAKYDEQGWHAFQYVAREFYSDFGDYDVQLQLDSSYTVAGTGILQNATDIGRGYAKRLTKQKTKTWTWKFLAKNVIDFAWAADPDYAHDKIKTDDGTELHFFYQTNIDSVKNNWKKMQPVAKEFFQYMKKYYGAYPYKTFSVIQGGDGGMEYPMCTLILGNGSFSGTTHTMIHEAVHNWFPMTAASDENQHAWLDEGFAEFTSDEAMSKLVSPVKNPLANAQQSYLRVKEKGLLEPPSTPSDFFVTNVGYGMASYIQGALLLHQLKYIMGDTAFYKGMKKYYTTWKFHHPKPADFIRSLEKSSKMNLRWFMSLWLHTTRNVDYAVDSVKDEGKATRIVLRNKGSIPLPAEVSVTFTDGKTTRYYIPLNETMASKKGKYQTLSTWYWVNPKYEFYIDRPMEQLEKIELDDEQMTMDTNRKNNVWTK